MLSLSCWIHSNMINWEATEIIQRTMEKFRTTKNGHMTQKCIIRVAHIFIEVFREHKVF